MQEFMLLVRNEVNHQATWSADTHRRFLESCERYIEGLKRDGRLKAAQPLAREGVMLSRPAGEWVQGPFSETAEAQVGYYHILAADLRDAVEIAKGNPEFMFSTTARIEVRPVKTREDVTDYRYPAGQK